MRLLTGKKFLGVLFLYVLPVSCMYAQSRDSLKIYDLTEVEVVEKARIPITRESVPLQSLDKESIQRLGLADLSEAVKRFSGVMVKDYGGIGGLKTVSIRSLGAHHTAVSYDGISISDAQSGHVDISRFTLDNVETVSLSIGQADNIFQPARMFASAGALSIKTAVPVFDSKPYNIKTKIGGGSFGLFNPNIQYDQQLSSKFSASLRADWLSAKSEYPFTLTNGTLVTREKRKNSDIHTLRLEGNLYGDLEVWGKIKAKVYYYDSERGLPGHVVLYNDYAKERLWNNNLFAQMHYEKVFNDLFAFQSSLKYDYSYSKYLDINDKYAQKKQEDFNTQEDLYASASILYTPVRHFSASLSTDISHSSLENNFINSALPERLNSLTAFAIQYKDSRLTATASLLGTYISDKVKAGDKPEDRKRLSPSASISWRPFSENSFRIRASFKDGFRVPTFTDMYYERIGNANLLPERAMQYNAGVTWSGRAGSLIRYLSLSADAYYNKVENKIVARPTMHVWRMTNVGEVEIKGFDGNISAEIPIDSDFELLISGSYSYQEALDVTNPETKNYRHQIVYTPQHFGSASFTIENNWVNATYSFMAVGKRYVLPQNIETNKIAGYVEQSVSLNKTIRVGKCDLRLQGEVLNLADVTYDVIQFYPMPGRSWRFSASLNF